MARSFATSLRQAARKRVTAVAARVADRVLRSASGWAERLSDLAESARPALRAASDPGEIVVVPRRPAQTSDVRPPTTETTPAPRINGTTKPSAASQAVHARPNPAAAQAEGLLGWRVAQHLRGQARRRGEVLCQPDPFALGQAGQRHDPEAVRTIRVATRRLRAFFELFGHRLPPKTARRLTRRLRRITRALGEPRDCDALAAALRARARGTNDPRQQAAFEHVWALVDERRRRSARRARKALAEVDRGELWAQIEQAVDRLVAVLCAEDADVAAILAGDLHRRLDAAFAKAPLPLPPDAGPEAVHQLRVQVKRLRYAIDLVRPALSRPKELTEPLRAAQRAIGRLRELEELHDWLRARKEELQSRELDVLAEGLQGAIERLAQERVEAAQAVGATLDGLHPGRLRRIVNEQLGSGPGTPTGTHSHRRSGSGDVR